MYLIMWLIDFDVFATESRAGLWDENRYLGSGPARQLAALGGYDSSLGPRTSEIYRLQFFLEL